ncbi:MAG: hypothetical protein L0H29_10960 [Sinobacteraceae bacterium]|nr:hypothetical protein [Nevskiaceae bacterium]
MSTDPLPIGSVDLLGDALQPIQPLEADMPRCDCCGNDYQHAFVVERDGERHTFDSFECAIHLLAPACEYCGCRMLGHGVATNYGVYCCAHCARAAGAENATDHFESV